MEDEKHESRAPQVSVVITCYNYGEFLNSSIQSVLEQTFQDFEIVVVDDGSTDNTPEIISQYTGLPNFRYIRQHNRGQANAKNRGISMARGRYLAFLDADDKWKASKLEKQMPLFSKDAVGVVFSLFDYMDARGRQLDKTRTGEYLLPRRGMVTEYLFLDNFVPFSTSMVRRECFRKLGVFDESLTMAIDWDLWLRLSTQYEFDYCDQSLVFYRKGHSGQMSKKTEERSRCIMLIMEKFQNQFPGMLSRNTIKKAYYYKYCTRGYYFSTRDPLKAAGHYINAIKTDPLSMRAYFNLMKLPAKAALGFIKR